MNLRVLFADIDECATNAHNCDTATSDCYDTQGSFHCRCKAGFKLNPSTNKCEGTYTHDGNDVGNNDDDDADCDRDWDFDYYYDYCHCDCDDNGSYYD